jgi:hypothetical protein
VLDIHSLVLYYCTSELNSSEVSAQKTELKIRDWRSMSEETDGKTILSDQYLQVICSQSDCYWHKSDRATAQAVSRRLSNAAARVRAQVGACGIFGGQVALGQVFSEYLGFTCQLSFHRLLRIHYLSFGAGGRRTRWTQSHPTPKKLKTEWVPRCILQSINRSISISAHYAVNYDIYG